VCWETRGRARLQKGDLAGGVTDLERALTLEPPGPEAERVRLLLSEAKKEQPGR
jgi:hypothetical protein